MNNELIAWIEDNKEKIKEALEWDLKQRQPMQILDDGRIVPVFKTLTDEEINELAENTLPNQAIGFVPSWQWIEFARTILRKAQEK